MCDNDDDMFAGIFKRLCLCASDSQGTEEKRKGTQTQKAYSAGSEKRVGEKIEGLLQIPVIHKIWIQDSKK